MITENERTEIIEIVKKAMAEYEDEKKYTKSEIMGVKDKEKRMKLISENMHLFGGNNNEKTK